MLLACLEVCDCEVVRICNADRDYVISGSALRYWLPTGLLHQGVEAICCRAEASRDVARAEPGRLAFAEAGFGASEPAPGAPWELPGLPDAANLLLRTAQRLGAARAAPAAPQPPAAGGAAADATAQQISALAEQVAELTKQLTKTRANLSALAAQGAANAGPDSPGASDGT